MKLITLGVAAALAVGSVGLAHAGAVNLTTNGDFSEVSSPVGARGLIPGTPTQLNFNPNMLNGASYGEFLPGWSTTGPLLDQNVDWFPSAGAASRVNAQTFDTLSFIPFIPNPRPLLPTTVTAPPNGGAFLAIQANMPDSGIQQTINGLTAGRTYALSFYWAATMDNIDTGVETSQLTASIGGASFTTSTQTVSSNNGTPFFGIPTHSTPTFNGWLSESFNFVADGSSSLLQFIAGGTPAGLPPYALLAGVSIDRLPVPEPPVLALFGFGLLGLGLVAVVARRRAQRHDAMDHDDTLA